MIAEFPVDEFHHGARAGLLYFKVRPRRGVHLPRFIDVLPGNDADLALNV